MNLKTYLASVNTTLKDFSFIIDVNEKYLSRIANGHIRPSHRLAKKIKTATEGNVDIWQMYEDQEQK